MRRTILRGYEIQATVAPILPELPELAVQLGSRNFLLADSATDLERNFSKIALLLFQRDLLCGSGDTSA